MGSADIIKSKRSLLPLQGAGGYGLSCPVDHVTINEHKARVNAFFVLALATTYLFSGFWPILVFLAIDFLLRAGQWGKYSLIGLLSDVVVKQLNMGHKPTDGGPKRFSAGMGFVFIFSILALVVFNEELAAQILTLVLCTFASFEAFAGFCIGCHIYSFGLFLTRKKS
ncbi:DUF4395 domain-containing protein [Mucilaginibacter myungsuensis]|uniref:DUF4395 domain-containing protein n=1 Tax=Mucilaginibacter myungsuensis TaxID=649104 RepID=A0A929KWT1_9SPHI|nr:DUF4395 domain-containing protein [Mucilaginibacter myungsuensis]MBE9662622.1 DUF4395 domain-containing protein [Mucilaginibacter myungsuensis]MDN3598042.1 DUF4395 domain-containing protein [Mucilaginibacter myungsuensis]